MSSDRPYYPPPPPPGQPTPPGPSPAAAYPQAPVPAQTGKPSPYWPLTVISFLCSFLVGGVALYFSYQVTAKWKVGDVPGARKASQRALWIGIAGIVVGVLAIILISSNSGASDSSYSY